MSDKVVGFRVVSESMGTGAAAERVVRASAWVNRAPPERAWLVDGWLPAGATTVLYGDGGTGKSLLAQQLATAVVTGAPFLGLTVRQGGALALFCEDDLDELHRRQAAINDALGVGYSALDNLRILSTHGEDSTLFAFQPGLVAGAATEFAHGFAMQAEKTSLAIIDTAADTFAGKEIDRYQVRQFLTWLNALARRTGAAVLLLAHPSLTGMATGRGQSGSTAWTNGARSHLYLEYAAEGDASADAAARRLSRKKSNYASKGDTLHLAWSDGAFVLDKAGVTGRANAKKQSLTDRERIALDALRDALRAHGEERNVGVETTVTETEHAQEKRSAMVRRLCVTFDQWRTAVFARAFMAGETAAARRQAWGRAQEALARKGYVRCAELSGGEAFAWEVAT